MKRDNLPKILLVLLLLAAGAWVAMKTEWVEHEVRTPPRGEALRNDLYVSQQLVRQLGAKVVRPEGLASMPPRTATLFLSAWHWDLFPERERQLRNWVEQGGHLVLEAAMLDNAPLQAWLPVRLLEGDDEDDDHGHDSLAQTKAKPMPACEQLTELQGVRPAYEGQASGFRLCGGHGYQRIAIRAAPQWAVEGRLGLDIARLPLGQGSVTVFTNSHLFDNQRVLDGDNALLAMATLQVRPGREIWFVSEEGRTPLLAWIWTEAWAAVLLGLLALLAALWRGAVRFGPLAASAAAGRRSMAEQLTGTAQFLRQHGAAALHAAQVRALDETARSHVRDYARLDQLCRAKAIAAATGLDANSLSRALDLRRKRSDRELPPTLQLLETARRLLRGPASPS